MKNTQKKLKAKHFRYLSKRYIKNPDLFLEEVLHQSGLNWSSNFNYMINSCFYPPMRTSTTFEFGYIYIHLAQMIEIGVVFLEQYNLEPMDKDDVFQYQCLEIFNAEVEDARIFPTKSLRAFYGFKSLKEWYNVLDNLLLYKDYGKDNMEQIQLYLEYIPIREFLVKLPLVLSEIYKRGGL